MQVLLIVLLFLLSGVTPAFAQKEPLEKTQQLIDNLINFPQDETKNKQLIDKAIDYNTILNRVFEPTKDKFSSDELKQVKSDIMQLIHLVAYPRANNYFNEAAFNFRAPVEEQQLVKIIQSTYIPSEDLEVDITYHWSKASGDWKIINIEFDEDSLINDYQAQFTRIIDKEGASSLVKKVADKLAKVKQR